MTDFPAMRAHEGIWEGTYTHLRQDHSIEDQHKARVTCLFPSDGDVFYRQIVHFTWADGREHHNQFDGIIRDGVIWFDTPTFSGKTWETDDGLVLLNLNRKDERGSTFFELIAMGEGGKHRARTWHWFKDGQIYRRTLCNESRISV